MPNRNLAFDASSVRSYDGEGRLRVSMAPISKACVSPYLGREIPNSEALGLDENTIYYLLRDPDELAKAASSFNGLPILIRHEPVSAADPKREIVVGACGSDAVFDGQFLKNSLSIWDGQAIDLIESGAQKELSSGYRFDVDLTPGYFKGAKFHGRMTNIRGNHLALVAKGRVDGAVVGDAAIGKEKDMAETDTSGATPTSISAAMSYLQSVLSEEEFKELAAILSRGSDSEALVPLKAAEMAAREAGEPGPVGRLATDAATAASYRTVLKRMGVTVDPTFSRPVLRAMYLAKTRPQTTLAAQKSFEERFPKAANISWAHRTR